MTALSQERMTNFAGPYPARGTYGIKANVRIFKGAQVGIDSAGKAMPADTIANGCVMIVGKSSATYDNRTGSELGGLVDACDVEVEYGVSQWANSSSGDAITEADVGKVCYAVDDQTVAKTSNGATRPVAGVITEVRSSKPYVYQGPGAGSVAGLTAIMPIPLASLLDPDGDPLAKFADGASAVPGFNLADSEALNLRWNNHATPNLVFGQIALPPDLDDTQDAQLEFLCSKSGATVGDATTLTVTAFILAAGDLHDADANAGGVTNAIAGAAAAKTTAVLSRTIAAADIPAGARSMAFTFKPTDGTLGTDDFMVHDVRLRYTRKAA